MDEIRRAYAVLGVQPGVSLAQLRSRYRALARQWHPDRHSADAPARPEAAKRMQQINDAYRTLLKYLVVDGGDPSLAGTDARQPSVRDRLSREEVERIVTAMGTDGPVDELLSSFDFPSRALFRFALAIGSALGAGLLASWLGAGSTLVAGMAVAAYIVVHVFLIWHWRAR